MSHIQSLNNIYKSQVPFVRLRLNDGWDYVWFTYDDERGFIQIASSYGNWAYSWSAMGEGVTLTEFFQSASADYLTDKFFGASHKEFFDADQAVRDIKKEIIRERRDGHLDKEVARALTGIIESLGDELDGNYENDRSRFLDAFAETTSLYNWKPEYWDNSWGMMPTGKYLALKNDIIPLIKKYFAGTLTES